MSTFSVYSIDNFKIEELNSLEEFIYKNNKNLENEFYTNTFLLDTSVEEFSLIEKYVYEIAMFQFKTLNIQYNPEKYYIEFWWRNDIFKSFHIDCDEKYRSETNKYLLPLLSNVLYLSDSYYSTILTNTNLEDYKYKEFNNTISISFSKKGKIVSFDSQYFHGVSNVFEEIDPGVTTYGRSTLMINLWDKRPKDIKYYKSNGETYYNKLNNMTFIKENEPEYINYNTNYEVLFEKLLYENCYDILYSLGKEIYKKYITIPSTIQNSTFVFSDRNIFTEKPVVVEPIVNTEITIQPVVMENIYTVDICLWILFEMKQHKHIEISADMVIFNFLLISLNNSILTKISNKYPVIKTINIKNMFFTSNIKNALIQDTPIPITSDKINIDNTLDNMCEKNINCTEIYIIIALKELTIYDKNSMYTLNIGDTFMVSNNNIKINETLFLLIILDINQT
jgi:hypothetical protein